MPMSTVTIIEDGLMIAMSVAMLLTRHKTKLQIWKLINTAIATMFMLVPCTQKKQESKAINVLNAEWILNWFKKTI